MTWELGKDLMRSCRRNAQHGDCVGQLLSKQKRLLLPLLLLGPFTWTWRTCLPSKGFRRHSASHLLVPRAPRLGFTKSFHPSPKFIPIWQSAVEMTLAEQSVAGEEGTESASQPEQSEESRQRSGRDSGWKRASGGVRPSWGCTRVPTGGVHLHPLGSW